MLRLGLLNNIVLAALACAGISASAATLYVDVNSQTPTLPFNSWSTAATNIQDAIDAASTGDLVLVTNGVYSSGGKVMAGDLTNRVALNKALTVQSVNGYSVTAIEGAWDPMTTNGAASVRCAWIGDGVLLSGFTLRNGSTRGTTAVTTNLRNGGGAWANSTNGIIANCFFTNNAAVQGGGIAYGTVNNSLLTHNTAQTGGAALFATLNNCTVVFNYCTLSFSSGGGTSGGLTRNCIVVNNFYLPSSITANYDSANKSYSYCCTTPSVSGTGNVNVTPVFVDSQFHMAAFSLCRNRGSARPSI